MRHPHPRALAATLAVGLAMVAVVSLWSAGQAVASSATAATLTFVAQKDTWINEGLPTQNQGGASVVNLGRADTGATHVEVQALVWFDASSIPAGATIISATLQLYQSNARDADSFAVWPRAINQSWDEMAVTWASRPTALDLGDPSTALDLSNGWKSWDVRHIVQSWASGTVSNEGILLQGDGQTLGIHEFRARSDETQPPKLIVAYDDHPPDETTTPTDTHEPSRTPEEHDTPTQTATASPTPRPSNTPQERATPTPSPTKTPIEKVTSTPTPNVDLEADHLEVTQGVQDLNNSVRLVANKRTYVRFHVSSNNGIHTTYARLTAQRGSNSVQLYPIRNGGYINVRSTPDRNEIDDSFLFELPNGYKTGTVQLTAEVNPEITPEIVPASFPHAQPGGKQYGTPFFRMRDPVESTYANNTVQTTVSFESVPTVNVVMYRVGYRLSGTTYWPPSSHRDQMIDWMERAYPVSNINVWNRYYYHGLAWLNPDGDLANPSCAGVNSVLAAKKLWDIVTLASIPTSAHYYGMVDEGGAFMRGCAATIPGPVASGPTGTRTWGWDTDGSFGDWYGAHELAHTYGRYHAEFCGAEGGVSYPYANGRISPDLTGDTAIYGFDISTRDIYEPDWHDLMTYCAEQWLSDFTYEALMTFFQTTPALPSAERRLLNQTDRLLVTGSIDPATDEVTLDPFFVIPNAGEIQPRTPGDYAIVLKNGAGAELARYAFTPLRMDGGPPTPHNSSPRSDPQERNVNLLLISELVPYVADTTRVDIEKQGAILAQVEAGAAAPTVELVSPNGGETLADDPIAVSWLADEPDGDPLFFSVQYSADDGATWETLALNLTEGSVELGAVNVAASSQGRFRVWASDGIHTTSDESDGSFVVPNHLPTIDILEPGDPSTFVVSQTVTLRGVAYDVDTGTMSGDDLEWLSDLDGALGHGETLSLDALSEGVHTVILLADDGEGAVVSDTVQVTMVVDPEELPPVPDQLLVRPATLTFGPTRGSASLPLTIENGNIQRRISWQALSSQPWIALGETEGETPDEILVTFDGSALEPGVYPASLTITSLDVPGQTVTVTIEATVGGEPIHLPLIMRGHSDPPWIPDGEGPWDDPLCFATSTDGMTFVEQGSFLDHAGVGNLLLTSEGQLIATYQYFSYEYQHMFDKIAYSVWDDQSQTWDGPHLVTITGLPVTTGGGPNPVDPTLVELSDGSLRLYFTYHPPGATHPHTTSAKAEAIDEPFVYEEGIRVSNDAAFLLDPAVVFYNGLWHYSAPNNDATPNNAVHATSENGLDFTRHSDITLQMDFLGNPLATDTGIRFYGTEGGVVSAFSTDGFVWQKESGVRAQGADPAVAKRSDGTYLMIHSGCARARKGNSQSVKP